MCNMKINVSKTKNTMVMTKTKILEKIIIDGCKINQVNHFFCYLGQIVTDDANIYC